MTDPVEYRKEAEQAIEHLKQKRQPLVDQLSVIDHAIVANMRIVELTDKLRDE